MKTLINQLIAHSAFQFMVNNKPNDFHDVDVPTWFSDFEKTNSRHANDARTYQNPAISSPLFGVWEWGKQIWVRYSEDERSYVNESSSREMVRNQENCLPSLCPVKSLELQRSYDSVMSGNSSNYTLHDIVASRRFNSSGVDVGYVESSTGSLFHGADQYPLKRMRVREVRSMSMPVSPQPAWNGRTYSNAWEVVQEAPAASFTFSVPAPLHEFPCEHVLSRANELQHKKYRALPDDYICHKCSEEPEIDHHHFINECPMRKPNQKGYHGDRPSIGIFSCKKSSCHFIWMNDNIVNEPERKENCSKCGTEAVGPKMYSLRRKTEAEEMLETMKARRDQRKVLSYHLV